MSARVAGGRANHMLMDGPILERQTYGPCQQQALKLWVVLARCFNSFGQALAHQGRTYGLTPPQFGVLEALAHLGPMKMCDIASKLLMSGANVTGVVDRLENKNMVRRVTEAGDRRTFFIHLTAEGGKLISKTFQRHARQVEALTSSLTPGEKRALIRLLKKLGKAVQLSNS